MKPYKSGQIVEHKHKKVESENYFGPCDIFGGVYTSSVDTGSLYHDNAESDKWRKVLEPCQRKRCFYRCAELQNATDVGDLSL